MMSRNNNHVIISKREKHKNPIPKHIFRAQRSIGDAREPGE